MSNNLLTDSGKALDSPTSIQDKNSQGTRNRDLLNLIKYLQKNLQLRSYLMMKDKCFSSKTRDKTRKSVFTILINIVLGVLALVVRQQK